jgi:hypothetical protein
VSISAGEKMKERMSVDVMETTKVRRDYASRACGASHFFAPDDLSLGHRHSSTRPSLRSNLLWIYPYNNTTFISLAFDLHYGPGVKPHIPHDSKSSVLYISSVRSVTRQSMHDNLINLLHRSQNKLRSSISMSIQRQDLRTDLAR